ncbi:MAG TPA: ABC transporter ATP-binding protein [Anaerolineales bacterium]|nr:ABC transporter ATP-binding protein [Anaerolineales bacterium]
MENIVEITSSTKYFASSDVLANNQVDFAVRKGEVHALVGENGAGKTTLMNILYGLIKPDSGTIRFEGREVEVNHPDDALRLGIGMVHQHFKLVPSFSIAENIMLGMEPNRFGMLRKRDEIEAVRELADRFGLPVDPRTRIRDLPVGMQQRVEILKVLARDVKVLILDEPTAVLTPLEVTELMTVVRELARRGRTIIFITHKLVEVKEVADRVSVMRGGKMVGTAEVAETSIPDMARMMVGRQVILQIKKGTANPGEKVFEARNITVADSSGLPVVKNLSLHVRAGEILGVAGVSGNGQTELVEAVTGMRPVEGGAFFVNNHEITGTTVGERRRAGMAHIPEDRIRIGLNLETNLDENLVVSRYKLPTFNRFGFLLRGAMSRFAGEVVERFQIAAARPGDSIATLSGGNMQKVVLGRELSGDPKFIVANQPTRGLDVGSIEFVHQTLIEARDNGAAVLLVSVELEEIMSLSDRIAVIFRGQIAGEVDPDTVTVEEIGLLMGGSTLDGHAAGEAEEMQTEGAP